MMNKSLAIFSKSLSLLFQNLNAALQISGVIFIASIFVTSAINVLMTGKLLVNPPNDGSELPPNEATALFLGALITAILFTWITVAWHRFVLLGEEGNSLLPNWNAGLVFGYIWRTILMFLLLLLLMIIPMILVGALGALMGPLFMMVLAGPLFVFFAYFGIFRLGLGLPGFSIGKPIDFRTSVEATKSENGTIAGLSILSVLTISALGLLGGSLAPNNLLGVAIIGVTNWITVLVSASLLTTLYGYIIDKRPLS